MQRDAHGVPAGVPLDTLIEEESAPATPPHATPTTRTEPPAPLRISSRTRKRRREEPTESPMASAADATGTVIGLVVGMSALNKATHDGGARPYKRARITLAQDELARLAVLAREQSLVARKITAVEEELETLETQLERLRAACRTSEATLRTAHTRASAMAALREGLQAHLREPTAALLRGLACPVPARAAAIGGLVPLARILGDVAAATHAADPQSVRLQFVYTLAEVDARTADDSRDAICQRFDAWGEYLRRHAALEAEEARTVPRTQSELDRDPPPNPLTEHEHDELEDFALLYRAARVLYEERECLCEAEAQRDRLTRAFAAVATVDDPIERARAKQQLTVERETTATLVTVHANMAARAESDLQGLLTLVTHERDFDDAEGSAVDHHEAQQLSLARTQSTYDATLRRLASLNDRRRILDDQFGNRVAGLVARKRGVLGEVPLSISTREMHRVLATPAAASLLPPPADHASRPPTTVAPSPESTSATGGSSSCPICAEEATEDGPHRWVYPACGHGMCRTCADRLVRDSLAAASTRRQSQAPICGFCKEPAVKLVTEAAASVEPPHRAFFRPIYRV